ncbi:MAG: hypothetical protein AAGB34_10645 [Planctomycetota bacterium]
MSWNNWTLPEHLQAVLNQAPSVAVAYTVDELVDLATRDAGDNGQHEVACC